MDSNRLDDIAERLTLIHLEQVRQGGILERHEQRSTQLEARVFPIERHVAMWGGVGKGLTVLAALGTLLALVLRVLG